MSFLMECADLQKILDMGGQEASVLLVDVCSEESYLAGHIPGSVHLLPKQLMAGGTPAPGKLPDEETLQALMSALGITPDTFVVAYDDEGGGWAGRLIWTLDILGHNNYAYLNGGIVAWREENRELETRANAPTPVAVSPKIVHRELIADIEDILEGLESKSIKIWDARSPEEYRGEKVLAQKGGHIPGAINCEWTSMMDPSNGLRIREDAQARLEQMGLDQNTSIITHCQSHHRSGFTYILGKLLGFDIKAYHGSWSEWGNHPTTPVEN